MSATSKKSKVRRIRNFFVGLGLISMLGSKGRAFVYDWVRMRQRRAEEEKRKRKATEKFSKLARKKK